MLYKELWLTVLFYCRIYSKLTLGVGRSQIVAPNQSDKQTISETIECSTGVVRIVDFRNSSMQKTSRLSKVIGRIFQYSDYLRFRLQLIASDKRLYFSRSYYLATYKDVKEKRMNACWHYFWYGWREGRNPSKYFNSMFYLKSNPDIAASGLNPLMHYLKYGRAEGRKPLA